MTEPVRLSKRLAAQLPCSRSQAELYIEGGWARVDGRVVEEPHFRVTDERIELDPGASLQPPVPVTLLLHKPAGHAAPQQLLQPGTHWPSDPSGLRVLKRHFSQLSPALGLETLASGLMVYTQDWRIARKLTEEAHLIETELMVDVQGDVTPAQLQLLQQVPATPPQAGPVQLRASVSSRRDGHSRLRLAIKGGPSGLVASLCERAGLQLLGLHRLRIGRVNLAAVPPGQWRYLQAHERF